MEKRIVLVTIAGLIAANLSCTNKTSGQQGEQPIEADSVAADTVVELDPMSPYWYDKDQTEVTFSEKKDTLYRFPRIKMGGIYSGLQRTRRGVCSPISQSYRNGSFRELPQAGIRISVCIY